MKQYKEYEYCGAEPIDFSDCSVSRLCKFDPFEYKQRGKTKQKGKTKKCSCGTKKYTGKEETPRGFGKCEECVPLNVVLRGTDDNLYENRKGGWFKLT